MQVKQLELDLWDVISTARQTPEDANLPMVFELLKLTLVDLDMQSQLRIAGDDVCQIADMFCDRSSSLFDELHSRASNGELLMPDDAFDRYVRQSMVVDFEQFIEPLQSLPRKIPEQAKNGNSIVSKIDKEVLIHALEQESLLSLEEEFQLAFSTAHAEDIAVCIEEISRCIASCFSPIRLTDLQDALQLPVVEVWLGLAFSKISSK